MLTHTREKCLDRHIYLLLNSFSRAVCEGFSELFTGVYLDIMGESCIMGCDLLNMLTVTIPSAILPIASGAGPFVLSAFDLCVTL